MMEIIRLRADFARVGELLNLAKNIFEIFDQATRESFSVG
jgi:hypothetical protein